MLLSFLDAMTLPSSTRKIDSAAELYSVALRALRRRAHSVHEMKEYLGRRASDEEMVSEVVARLRESKYLDDARYAADYARLHAQSRRQGRYRITRELRARGVPDRHIETALAAAFAETDESALARVRMRRAVARLRGPLDQRKIAALHRSLMRAGFSSDIIRAELRSVAQGDLAEAAEAMEGS